MVYFYIKALHLIFIVTWFAGMFYLVRLYIYNREALDKPENERMILQQQFSIMIKRLLFGITLPSAIITLIFGTWLFFNYPTFPQWLHIKLGLVFLLYLYHISLHVLYRQQKSGNFKYSSNQLRIWNEVPTLFLVAIVMLAIVKQGISLVYGLAGLLVLIIVLMSAIKIYRNIRG